MKTLHSEKELTWSYLFRFSSIVSLTLTVSRRQYRSDKKTMFLYKAVKNKFRGDVKVNPAPEPMSNPDPDRINKRNESKANICKQDHVVLEIIDFDLPKTCKLDGKKESTESEQKQNVIPTTPPLFKQAVQHSPKIEPLSQVQRPLCRQTLGLPSICNNVTISKHKQDLKMDEYSKRENGQNLIAAIKSPTQKTKTSSDRPILRPATLILKDNQPSPINILKPTTTTTTKSDLPPVNHTVTESSFDGWSKKFQNTESFKAIQEETASSSAFNVLKNDQKLFTLEPGSKITFNKFTTPLPTSTKINSKSTCNNTKEDVTVTQTPVTQTPTVQSIVTADKRTVQINNNKDNVRVKILTEGTMRSREEVNDFTNKCWENVMKHKISILLQYAEVHSKTLDGMSVQEFAKRIGFKTKLTERLKSTYYEHILKYGDEYCSTACIEVLEKIVTCLAEKETNFFIHEYEKYVNSLDGEYNISFRKQSAVGDKNGRNPKTNCNDKATMVTVKTKEKQQQKSVSTLTPGYVKTPTKYVMANQHQMKTSDNTANKHPLNTPVNCNRNIINTNDTTTTTNNSNNNKTNSNNKTNIDSNIRNNINNSNNSNSINKDNARQLTPVSTKIQNDQNVSSSQQSLKGNNQQVGQCIKHNPITKKEGKLNEAVNSPSTIRPSRNNQREQPSKHNNTVNVQNNKSPVKEMIEKPKVIQVPENVRRAWAVVVNEIYKTLNEHEEEMNSSDDTKNKNESKEKETGKISDKNPKQCPPTKTNSKDGGGPIPTRKVKVKDVSPLACPTSVVKRSTLPSRNIFIRTLLPTIHLVKQPVEKSVTAVTNEVSELDNMQNNILKSPTNRIKVSSKKLRKAQSSLSGQTEDKKPSKISGQREDTKPDDSSKSITCTDQHIKNANNGTKTEELEIGSKDIGKANIDDIKEEIDEERSANREIIPNTLDVVSSEAKLNSKVADNKDDDVLQNLKNGIAELHHSMNDFSSLNMFFRGENGRPNKISQEQQYFITPTSSNEDERTYVYDDFYNNKTWSIEEECIIYDDHYNSKDIIGSDDRNDEYPDNDELSCCFHERKDESFNMETLADLQLPDELKKYFDIDENGVIQMPVVISHFEEEEKLIDNTKEEDDEEEKEEEEERILTRIEIGVVEDNFLPIITEKQTIITTNEKEEKNIETKNNNASMCDDGEITSLSTNNTNTKHPSNILNMESQKDSLKLTPPKMLPSPIKLSKLEKKEARSQKRNATKKGTTGDLTNDMWKVNISKLPLLKHDKYKECCDKLVSLYTESHDTPPPSVTKKFEENGNLVKTIKNMNNNAKVLFCALDIRRSLNQHTFPEHSNNRNDKATVLNNLKKSCKSLNERFKGNMTPLSFFDESLQDLLKKGVIKQKEQLSDKSFASMYKGHGGRVIVLLNYIEHIRIVTSSRRGDLKKLFSDAHFVSSTIEDNLKSKHESYCWDERLGYINSSSIGMSFRCFVEVTFECLEQIEDEMKDFLSSYSFELGTCTYTKKLKHNVYRIDSNTQFGMTEADILKKLHHVISVMYKVDERLQDGEPYMDLLLKH